MNRLPTWPTAVLPIAILGAVFMVMPTQLHSLGGTAVLAAVGGLAIPLGIGAHNRILATDPAPGADRRAAFAVDQIADGGASAMGMLAGGAIIAAAGTTRTLLAAGALQMMAAAAALTVAARPQR